MSEEGMMQLARMFYGNRVRLAPIQTDDHAQMARWYTDSAFTRNLEGRAATLPTEAQIRRENDESERGRDTYFYGVRTLDTDRLIGMVMLDGIQWTHGSGWVAIGIGDSEYRGRGYGQEALTLLLDFAFDELNLHRLNLTVFSYNTNAITLYERLGFVREGAFRESIHRDGQRFDTYLYGLLRREWAARRGS